jgi:hypothetical protein
MHLVAFIVMIKNLTLTPKFCFRNILNKENIKNKPIAIISVAGKSVILKGLGQQIEQLMTCRDRPWRKKGWQVVFEFFLCAPEVFH